MLFLFTVTFVNADSIGSFQLDVDDVEIYQVCSNCTSCNFTRVMGPNNQTILSNLVALSDGDYYYYNILHGNFTENGDYSYTYTCGNSEETEAGKIDFIITYTGEEVDGETITVYISSIAVILFLFFFFIFLSTKLPSKDATDEDGIILQISNLKHLRPVLWGLSWGMILAMMFIMANITLAYLPSTMIGGLFWAIYTMMFWITMIMLPLYFVWIFVGIFKDKEFKRMIERGVDIKATP